MDGRRTGGSIQPLYRNLPSYQGQPLSQMVIHSDSVVASTTVTSGVIALVYDTDPVTNVINWATRFQSLEEFRVVKTKAIVNCFSSTNPGAVVAWFDETSNTTPTATAAQDRTIKTFSAGDVTRTHTLVWRPKDLLDLQYSSTGVSKKPVYFKLYSDNANYGSSIVASQYLSVHMAYTIQFRGFNTV
jgi:hypothetical protein